MSLHYGVVGAGPVGRVFAGLLRQGGQPVTMLCHREQTRQLLARRPVVVKGKLEAYAQLDSVLLEPSEFVHARPDVVLVCTKAIDTRHVLHTLRDAGSAPGTIYVSCQNGIDTERVIGEVFGAAQALRLVLNMGCDVSCGNEVVVTFCTEHVLSQPVAVADERVHRIADDLRACGLPLRLSARWRDDVFRKALLNASLGSLCALTRHCMGCVMGQPEARELVARMLREGMAISAAEGIELPPDYFDYAMRYLDQGGEHRPSILVDVERGKTTENEFHCAELARLALRHRVPSPIIDITDKLLRCTESY